MIDPTQDDRQWPHIFGIRHLSPAGSWHLRQLIERVEPTAILIEAPADGTPLLNLTLDEKLRLPIALLAFTQARPIRSIIFPLADYSPEWIALKYGLEQGVTIRFIDLPTTALLSPATKPAELLTDSNLFVDIARRAGAADADSWWERTFEHLHAADAYRSAIDSFAQEMRELIERDSYFDQFHLMREAFMRRAIVETIAAGHAPARTIVVCGALHVPALTPALAPLSDAELRALPNEPVNLTLMPYSYPRLSRQAGFGAGNIAPRYFQILSEELQAGRPTRLPARYFAELAESLRRAGTIRASGDLIEAVRLANGLAALAEANAPTLCDLEQAAITCLGYGDRRLLTQAFNEINIGSQVGSLPSGIAGTPLQVDFQQQIAALKLKDYLQDKEQIVKGSTGKPWLDRRIDRSARRSETAERDRKRSIFFHRLEILALDFAREITTEKDRELSTYKEVWAARWRPEAEIRLADCSLLGDSIAEVAALVLQQQVELIDDIGRAAELARRAADCDLPAGLAAVLARVQALASDAGGFISLTEASRQFAALVRYRDVTELDITPLVPLLEQICLRAVLVVRAAARCDNATANAIGEALERLLAVALVDWNAAGITISLPVARLIDSLSEIAADHSYNPYISGLVSALLLERGLIELAEIEIRVEQRLLPGAVPADSALFFEGLVSRNRLALLMRKNLWRAIAEYIDSLDDDQFLRILAGMRRTFATFSPGEVRQVVAMLAEFWQTGASELMASMEVRLDEAEIEKLAEDLAGLEDFDL